MKPSLVDSFRNWLLPKLSPMHNYAQIATSKDGDSVVLSVMLFNKLPRHLSRKIPKTYRGIKVITKVIGSGNVVTTGKSKPPPPIDKPVEVTKIEENTV